MKDLRADFWRSASGIALAALMLLISVYAATDTAEATSFSPRLGIEVIDPTPGAVSDISTNLIIASPDSNFGALVTFTPPGWFVARDADVTDGAIVAVLKAKTTLGLLGNPCNNVLNITFNMMDATTNIANTVTYDDNNNNDQPDSYEDFNGNGLPDAVDKYPEHLAEIFPGMTPRARLYGQLTVPGVSGAPVDLNFVIFEPGVTIPASDLIAEEINFDPAFGYPSAVVLLNPTEPPEVSPVTDFCSALVTVTTTFGTSQDNICTTSGALPFECIDFDGVLLGVPGSGSTPDEGGAVARRNPDAAGDYNFATLAFSQWDADNDGIENGLDPCPLDPDPDFDPRRAGPAGDTDQDGIPDTCDPNPNQPSPIREGYDEDGDGFNNRADNCPNDANGLDIYGEVVEETQEDVDNDGIGDACDPFLNDRTNGGAAHRHEGGITVAIDIGPGASGEGFAIFVEEEDFAQLTGGASPVDTDGDGVPDANDNCPNTPSGESVDANGCSASQLAAGGETEEEQQELAREELLAELEVGMNLTAGLESVPVGGSTPIVAACAEMENDLKPLPGVEITFKIDSQPGDDADLDGNTEAAKTSDAEGFAEATLNVGSTAGEIVVSATAECGTDTRTVTVTGEALGETTGPTDAAGGAATGVGALAPAVSSIPIWAAIASGLGGAGLLAGLGAIVSRVLRRRR